jgi:hypothetical protein
MFYTFKVLNLKFLKILIFEKYTFELIDVEHNYIEPRRTKIRDFLLSNDMYIRAKIIVMICTNILRFEI